MLRIPTIQVMLEPTPNYINVLMPKMSTYVDTMFTMNTYVIILAAISSRNVNNIIAFTCVYVCPP